jgi:hypothetical protein
MELTKNISAPQSKIIETIKECFPSLKIEEEFSLGDGLRLDIFIRSLGLGIEYHGRQHLHYVQHFHKSLDGFKKALQRDLLKVKRCKELSINLVIFLYDEDLSKESILKKILGSKTLEKYDPEFGIDSAAKRNKEAKDKIKAERRKVKAKDKQKQIKIKPNNNEKLKQIQKVKNREFQKENYRKAKKWKQEQKKSPVK